MSCRWCQQTPAHRTISALRTVVPDISGNCQRCNPWLVSCFKQIERVAMASIDALKLYIRSADGRDRLLGGVDGSVAIGRMPDGSIGIVVQRVDAVEDSFHVIVDGSRVGVQVTGGFELPTKRGQARPRTQSVAPESAGETSATHKIA